MVNDVIDYGESKKIKPQEGFIYLLCKRLFDILASSVGLIVLSPLFLIVALLIKIENPEDNIIFSQTRCGKNGKLFSMYKFRSMVSNAEDLLLDLKELNEMDGPVFKIKNDPRITKIGRFIRKTSIDELPQLLNILIGDMSFVGPRPPIPNEVEQYNEYQMQRLIVKPGLTCIWQVSGRNAIGFDDWVEMDLEYIEKRNLIFDLMLIFKTFKVVLGDENAS